MQGTARWATLAGQGIPGPERCVQRDKGTAKSMADNLVSRIRAWLSRSRRLDGRTAAEQSLREANERYELILAGANAAIWDWDVPRRTVAFSRAGRPCVGLPSADRRRPWRSGARGSTR